jgi:hypothetical protein
MRPLALHRSELTPAVEALDECVVCRFAGPAEVQRVPVLVGAVVKAILAEGIPKIAGFCFKDAFGAQLYFAEI